MWRETDGWGVVALWPARYPAGKKLVNLDLSMMFNVTSGAWLALLLIFTATIGVVLIKFGAWPKRRGTERRCRRCNYVVEK